MSPNTLVPATLEEQQKKAEGYLDSFSKFTTYKHRRLNPYLAWLKSSPKLRPDAMYRFFNFWYPVSRHQPQILLQIAAAYPKWSDRRLLINNYIEEDGMLNVGDQPHYDLLEELIVKLGGKLDVDPEAEEMVNSFHLSIQGMSDAEATGYVAAIEHPALDISDYFQLITVLAGRRELLKEDLYISIHIDVEPKHIIWSHGNALDWMEESKERGEQVLKAYQSAMTFWDKFWELAFRKLGYT